jgi:sigma-B regulation protein RsbU (phosphoserine phosphatase)
VAGTLSPWRDAVAHLQSSSPLIQPSGLPDAVNAAVRAIGAHMSIYLVDREQRALHALPEPPAPEPEPLPIDTTMAGRAFQVAKPMVQRQPRRLWLPLLDGVDRLGVLEVRLGGELAPDDPGIQEGCRMFAGYVGQLVVRKTGCGDTLRRTCRSRPMTTGAELLWRMLPPMTYATDRLVISGIMEPCYEVGGDAFDYAVDNDVARLAVLDAIGHGLGAGLTAAVTLAAMRGARACGRSLPAVAATVDDELVGHFGDLRFVTGVLAELDVNSGTLHYINAGHPPPILLRHGKAVGTLMSGRRLPLGLQDNEVRPARLILEPGDRLLFYTDGAVEARDPEGNLFGVARLVDLAERHSASGRPAPETLRRLSHAVLDHQKGEAQDDTTMMLVEWAPGPGGRISR